MQSMANPRLHFAPKVARCHLIPKTQLATVDPQHIQLETKVAEEQAVKALVNLPSTPFKQSGAAFSQLWHLVPRPSDGEWHSSGCGFALVVEIIKATEC